jgi:hypothetical protein
MRTGNTVIVKYLHYLNSSLRLEIQDNAWSKTKPVLDFFSSHFAIDEQCERKPITTIRVHAYSDFDLGCYGDKQNGQHVVMRTSTAKEFQLSCTRCNLNGRTLFICDNTRSNIVMDKSKNIIDIYVSKDSQVQFIELIRDLIVKNEESSGMCILHASAVQINGRGLVFVGGKGAGKSTLIYECLRRGNIKYVSGDRVFLKVRNGKIWMKGWPDYPHLGVGTIRRYSELRSLVETRCNVDIESLKDTDKVLIHPEIVGETLSPDVVHEECEIHVVVFPEFIHSKKCEISEHENGRGKEVLSHLMYSADYWQTGWHDFITPDYSGLPQALSNLESCLDSLKYYRLRGNLLLTERIIRNLVEC